MRRFGEIEALSEILREAARREIMPRFRNLGENGVRQKKSAIDVVTEADEAAERLIAGARGKAFPRALSVGEEAASADPGVVAGLAEADLAFVIDPVDGTLNYASDLPLFAVMAAALHKGEPSAALTLSPNLDDCALARRGDGACWVYAAGRRRGEAVAAGAPIGEMTGMVSLKYFEEPHRSRIPGRFSRFADVSSLRCCGQEYRLAASGTVHLLMYGRLHPWDHAPGSLIHAEAGGHVRLLDGAPYRAGVAATGLLCAPDAASWLAVRDAFFA